MNHVIIDILREVIPPDGNPEKFREELKRRIDPGHDSSGHNYKPDQNQICEECGWIHQDAVCDNCGKQLVDHVQNLLSKTADLGTITLETIGDAVRTKSRRGIAGILIRLVRDED